MPVLHLIGHHETFAATELLRIFFGAIREEAGSISAGSDDTVITSRMDDPAVCMEPDQPDLVTIETVIGSIRVSRQVARANARREIKRQLYQILSQWTGCNFPWGSLTGIRPTQVAAECLAQTPDLEAARRILTEHWFVSAEKADLALKTAFTEQRLLAQMAEEALLVYIGIPFCPSRCSYCSFITCDALGHASLLDPYVEAVIQEAENFFAAVRQPVAALYIGGGTPTSLSAVQLQRLLQRVLPQISLLPDAELTVEAGRPDTIDAEKLAVLRAAGITRICINPQTFQEKTLTRVGRHHTVRQFVEAWQLARSMGFGQINADLIAGLPGEAPEDLADSVQKLLALEPTGVTLHALALKRSSALCAESDGQSELQPQPAWDAMLALLRRQLAEAGLHPYYLYRQKQALGGLENTGFARTDSACHYNVGMMSDQRPVIGIGSGSMSKRLTGGRLERLQNPRNIAVYLERIDDLAQRKAAWFSGTGR